VIMSSKTEKARGVGVRVSRAKSRVDAKKRSRVKARKPKSRPEAPAPRAPARGHGKGAAPRHPVEAGPAVKKKKGSDLRKTGSEGTETAKRRRAAKTGKIKESPQANAASKAKVKKGRNRGTPRYTAATAREPETLQPVLEAHGTAGGSRAGAREASAPREMRSGVRPARIAILGVLLVVSLAALLWIYTSTGVLNVKSVEVKGNEVLDADYLRSLSGITRDTHLLKMDVKAVESALLSEPYVAGVNISRRYPNTVVLGVTERQPTGVILQNGKYNLVDQEGMILESADARPPGLVEIKDLELVLLFPGMEISGMDFATVTSLLGSLPPALKEVATAVGLKGGGGLYLEGRGTVVIYGEASDLSRKNVIALMALTGLVDRYAAVEYIDVSFPDHPVLKPVSSGQPAVD